MLGRSALLATVATLAFASILTPAPVAPAAAPHFAHALLDAPGTPIPAGVVSTGQEPMVLVDRAGGYVLVGDTSQLHRSTNDGTSWTHPGVPGVPGAFTDGLALAQDADGTLYAADTQGQVIFVDKSVDGGVTWSRGLPVAGWSGIADRPWLAATGSGKVALLYFADEGERCALSTDGGQTFITESVANSANAGNAIFDAHGRLWYAVGGKVAFWSTACLGAAAGIPAPSGGAQIFEQLAVDDSGTSPVQYLAHPSSGNGQMLLLGHQGLNPSAWKSLAVSPATVKSSTFGAIAQKPGEVAVAWYGSGTAGDPSASGFPSSASWNVYVARVTNFWAATPTVTVSTVEVGNHVGGFCMSGITCTSGDRDLLDYMGIAYGNDGKLRIAWGHDGATSNADVRFADLG
jgi:hypothetical protein